MRKAFNFYNSYFDIWNELNNADKIKFMDALLNRQFYGVEPKDLTGMAKFGYISQKHSIDKQIKGFEDKTNTKLTHPTQGGTQGPCLQVQEEVQVQVQEKGKVEKFFIKTSNQEKNVKLKNSEVETLKEKLGEKGFLFCVNKLSDYKLAKGATYKSDYGAINSWVIKEWDKQKINGKEKLTGAQAFLKQFEQ